MKCDDVHFTRSISSSPEPALEARALAAIRGELSFFATVPKGMESLLVEELRALGAEGVRQRRAGVAFKGPLELGYRACLWSRLASRILLGLAKFQAPSPEELYDGIRSIPWSEHLGPRGSFAVDFNTVDSAITHSHFGALKVKDAIVDQFRDTFGERPSVVLERPELRIGVYLRNNRASVSLDLSGESLHRRGYRAEGLLAPLKENLAAAVLLSAGWQDLIPCGAPLIDPMCGSGTLLIEAALMSLDIAPGLLRPYYGFLGWRGHDPALWARLLEEAHTRKALGASRRIEITGHDRDAQAVRATLANVARAGLTGRVHLERQDLSLLRPRGTRCGLVVVNPPYGERLGQDLPKLYGELGEVLRRRFGGWQAAVLTGDPRLAYRLRLRPRKISVLYNGAIACKLFGFAIPEQPPPRTGEAIVRRPLQPPPAANAEMFANRLRKNLSRLGRWARRSGIECYRLYDADLPEYALAIDLYQSTDLWAHVQEYEAPARVDPFKAEGRLQAALAVIPEVLGVSPERVSLKLRRKQKGCSQYQRLAETDRFFPVREGAYTFLVNLHDYLDTGLFLDHRPLRALLYCLAKGKRFLNLFGYTGTATVAAASGGAAGSTTVDLSRTYLDWARRNLALNGLEEARHELIQADCLDWLAASGGGPAGQRYDLIFLDPPSFSNSKRMARSLDAQRDHVELLVRAGCLLEPQGILIFSTNRRRFQLDRASLAQFNIENLTQATIPPDFARLHPVHQCWKLTHPDRPAP